MTIKDAVKGNGYIPGLYHFSIKNAQRVMLENENLIFAGIFNVATVPVHAHLEVDTLNIKGKDAGVFAVTDKRAFFCTNVAGKGSTKQIAIKDIQSVDDSTTLIKLAKLRIRGITEMFVIDANMAIVQKINAAIGEATKLITPNTPVIVPQVSEADEILKYKNLLDQGVLTQDEFDAKKKQLLGL